MQLCKTKPNVNRKWRGDGPYPKILGKPPQEVLKFGETETWNYYDRYIKPKKQTGFDSVSFPDIKMVGLAPICLIDRKIMPIIVIGYLSGDHLGYSNGRSKCKKLTYCILISLEPFMFT